jgi:DNA-binding beta-propeller fold protein YncE
MDADGKVGRTYGARTTPHMYVIDPAGKLVYAGAIDSKPSSNPADIKTATNYVSQALAESLAGKAVSQPVTQAYGCSVKYGD